MDRHRCELLFSSSLCLTSAPPFFTARAWQPRLTERKNLGGEQDKLLERAVTDLNKDHQHKNDRVVIPWAKVGPYIKKNGGTHEFGPQACHKRWDELVAGAKLRGSLADQNKKSGGRGRASR